MEIFEINEQKTHTMYYLKMENKVRQPSLALVLIKLVEQVNLGKRSFYALLAVVTRLQAS